MTEEELKKVPFKMVAHLAIEDCHCSTYISKDGRIGFCDHVPKKANGDFRKGYRHWQIDGKVYKTRKKFLEALKDYNPDCKIVDIKK